MKKIRRNDAIGLFLSLGKIALGYLDENTLEAVMSNFNVFRRVSDEFDALSRELSNRLYKEIEPSRHKAFFDVVAKYEVERDLEKRNELYKIMETYEDIMPLYKKHVSVMVKLLNKDIEIDIVEMNADDFIKGVVMGEKNIPIREIRAKFAPMFKEDKKEKESDFSELDEILTLK